MKLLNGNIVLDALNIWEYPLQVKVKKERKLEFIVYLLPRLNGLKDPIIHVGIDII